MSKVTAQEDVVVVVSPLPAWVCVQQATEQTQEYIQNYTSAERDKVQALFERISNAYISSKVYLNYRKNHVVIKVDKPKIHDRASTTTENLNEWLKAHGVEKQISKQGHYLFRVTPQWVTVATYGA